MRKLLTKTGIVVAAAALPFGLAVPAFATGGSGDAGTTSSTGTSGGSDSTGLPLPVQLPGQILDQLGVPLPGGDGLGLPLPLPGGDGLPLPGGDGLPLPGGDGLPLPGGDGLPLPSSKAPAHAAAQAPARAAAADASAASTQHKSWAPKPTSDTPLPLPGNLSDTLSMTLDQATQALGATGLGSLGQIAAPAPAPDALP